MSKREKSVPWHEPEFDEVGFMRKEMRAARVTLAVVLWTLPAAGLSYGLTLAGVAVVAFFAGIGMMFLLKWVLPILRIDTSEYKRKDWIGHAATFFFSWLAFWILLLNPPFADLTNPTIYYATLGATPVQCNIGAAYTVAAPSRLNVSAGDNVAVTRVTITYGAGAPVDMAPAGGTLWSTSVPPPGTQTPAQVIAYDAAGHAASCQFAVRP